MIVGPTNIPVTSKKNNMTAIAETVIILVVFVTFMGYLGYKLAYEDGY